MPAVGPVKRADLIRYLRVLGFGGPYAGARQQIMARGNATLRFPNPQQGEIGTGLLLRVLKQAGIARVDWERL